MHILLVASDLLFLEELFELLTHFFDFWRNDDCAIALRFVPLIIVLMILFSTIILAKRLDLCDDHFVLPHMIVGDVLFDRFRNLALLVIFVEDNRAILSSYIIALAVKRGGVVSMKKDR